MSNFETEYWNSVAPFKSKYEFIKMHILIDINETIKMLTKARAEGNEKVILDIMTKKADANKFYAKRSIPINNASSPAKEHLPRAEAKEDLPF